MGHSPIEFENLYSLNAQKVDRDGEMIFETKWTHYIAFQQQVVYQFHTYMIFNIEEDETPANEEQAREILYQSHKTLIDKWEERRQAEVNFFPSILPLTIEQIDPFVLPLIEKLNEPPQSGANP